MESIELAEKWILIARRFVRDYIDNSLSDDAFSNKYGIVGHKYTIENAVKRFLEKKGGVVDGDYIITNEQIDSIIEEEKNRKNEEMAEYEQKISLWIKDDILRERPIARVSNMFKTGVILYVRVGRSERLATFLIPHKEAEVILCGKNEIPAHLILEYIR